MYHATLNLDTGLRFHQAKDLQSSWRVLSAEATRVTRAAGWLKLEQDGSHWRLTRSSTLRRRICANGIQRIVMRDSVSSRRRGTVTSSSSACINDFQSTKRISIGPVVRGRGRCLTTTEDESTDEGVRRPSSPRRGSSSTRR